MINGIETRTGGPKFNTTFFAFIALTAFLLLAAHCTKADDAPAAAPATTLAQARSQFKTNLLKTVVDNYSVPNPPNGVFNVVQYDSPVGPLPAYVTPDPRDGQLHPAILWIHGGDCNSIGDCWSRAPAD